MKLKQHQRQFKTYASKNFQIDLFAYCVSSIVNENNKLQLKMKKKETETFRLFR